MINDTLDALGKLILHTYPVYNEGYTNVFKPSQKDIVINDKGDYCGISDNNGNYFYIRSLRETAYTAKYTSCRPIAYDATTQCRIVSVMHTSDYEAHRDAIIYMISRAGHFITRAVYDNTAVFREETGTDIKSLTLESLSLVSVDFTVREIVTMKKCPPEICKC